MFDPEVGKILLKIKKEKENSQNDDTIYRKIDAPSFNRYPVD